MRKLLFLSAIIAYCQIFAQLTTTENYVQATTCLDADCIKKAVTVEYIDGLGRTKQIVDVKASPTGKDVVTHVEYDGFGRQVKEFLPVPQSGTFNGGIVPNPLANATNPNIYGNERIFTEKKLESSPLDRLQEQTKVGNAWADKPIKYEYSVNSQNEIRKYVTTTTIVEGIMHSTLKVANDTGSANGFYKENMIYKNIVKDEDGNTTIEFLNGEDQLILSRKVLSASQNADTYYVYNEYNLLAFIVPPKASEEIKNLSAGTQIPDNVLNNLCYQYRPDGDARIAEKKLPNKGWEYFVYDKADRLVLTQDAVLRTNNNNFATRGWIFTKYDNFGRVAYTGFFTNTASRASMQNALNSMTAHNHEIRSTVPFNLNGMDVFYTKTAFPTGSMKILSVNYYDTYPPYSFNPPFPTLVYGKNILTDDPNNPATINHSTKSFHVLTLLKNIEDDNWTKNYKYYDTKGRIASTYSINHLGGYTKVENDLGFTGIAKEKKTYHKRLNTDVERVVTEIFEYDNQNRLLVHKHQINSNPVEILAQNEYNELSQVKTKKIGGTSPTAPLQIIDHSYNIQGWLTKINDPNNLNGKLFGYEMKYQNPVNTSLSPAKYNGNIAEIDWKTNNDGVLRRYGYQYDALNRLLKGIYQEPHASVPQNDFYNEELSYDLNGNITSLQRKSKGASGFAEQIDDLGYSYTGNRLDTVIDTSLNYRGYPDVSGNTISYDDNGNMKDHVDKGILQIDYNFLNLPKYIKFNQYIPSRGGARYVNTAYLYRADGIKLKKQYNYKDGNNLYLATKTTEYIDSFHYEGIATLANPSTKPSLKFSPTAEGYFDFEKNKYIYNYVDHLGNVRLSYFNNGTGAEVLEENNYYPFGLKHEGYNVLVGNPAYAYKFQGQELQETGWYNFKWRNYMPDVARFFNIDPLAEDYTHNSTYAFSENRVIDNIELEGLEGEDFRFRLNQRLKGGVQARVETAAQKDAGDSFKAVIQTVTPIEDVYSLFSGKDFDGNAVSTEQSLSMLALSLVPEVKGEAKVAVKVAAKAEAKALAKAEANALAKTEAKTAKRGSFRKGTVKDSWDNAKNGSKPNTKQCPTCKKDVEGNPHNKEKRNGPNGWDMSHNPSWTKRDHTGMTRKEQLDDYNKGAPLECASCNRSGGNNDSRFHR